MHHPSQQRQPRPARKAFSITVMRNGKGRSYRIRPWLACAALGGTALFLTAYIGATAYLIYRDDLLGTALARQVAMQYTYEDRIQALRSEIDRVTSRHAVRAAGVEERLAVLLERQETIQRQQSALDALVKKAGAAGLALAANMAGAPPAEKQATSAPADGLTPLAYAPTEPEAGDIVTGTLIRSSAAERASDPETLAPLLFEMRSALDRTEGRQTLVLEPLAAQAESEADKLATALAPIGITYKEAGIEKGPQGGPFIPAPDLHFVEKTVVLSRRLDEIAALRRSAEAMPLSTPISTARVSSRFGYRQDPFLNRPGFHPGLDFAAATGTEVRATAAGTVVWAGWKGGYGYMVELRHAGDLSTRYGHLSAILVEAGIEVAAGALIGRVGSTGRSTGPHLHYETRRGAEAVNPALYLAAGRAL